MNQRADSGKGNMEAIVTMAPKDRFGVLLSHSRRQPRVAQDNLAESCLAEVNKRSP
jgi:hypothetical protein